MPKLCDRWRFISKLKLIDECKSSFTPIEKNFFFAEESSQEKLLVLLALTSQLPEALAQWRTV